MRAVRPLHSSGTPHQLAGAELAGAGRLAEGPSAHQDIPSRIAVGARPVHVAVGPLSDEQGAAGAEERACAVLAAGAEVAGVELGADPGNSGTEGTGGFLLGAETA